MRFLGLVLAVLLVTSIAFAATPDAPHNFGGLTCPQHVPCPDTAATADTYASVANACVTQFFGFANPDGFFDSYKGLDGGNCLATKSNALPKLTSVRTEPHCCVVKAADSSCSIHCDMVAAP